MRRSSFFMFIFVLCFFSLVGGVGIIAAQAGEGELPQLVNDMFLDLDKERHGDSSFPPEDDEGNSDSDATPLKGCGSACGGGARAAAIDTSVCPSRFYPIKYPYKTRDFTVFDKNGTSHRSEDLFSGKMTLAYFWTFLDPDLAVDLKHLAEIKAQVDSPHLEVIFISIDTLGGVDEYAGMLEAYPENNLVHYVLDDMAMWRYLFTKHLPVAYLFNPEGKIAYVWEGKTDWALPEHPEAVSQAVKKAFP